MTEDENSQGVLQWSTSDEGFEWVCIETTQTERLIELSCCAGRTRGLIFSRTWKLGLVWCLANLCMYAVWGPANLPASGGSLLLADLLLTMAILIVYEHHVLRCISVASESRWRCALSENGLLIDTPTHNTLWQWAAVTALEPRSDALLVYLTGNQVLLLPRRCFASPDTYLSWLSRLESLSGKRLLAKAALPPCGLKKVSPLSGFFGNLYAGLNLLMFSRRGARAIYANGVQFFLLTICWMCARLSADFSALSADKGFSEALAGSFYAHGVLDGLAVVFLLLMCASVVARLAENSRVLETFLILVLPLWWIAVLQEAISQWEIPRWRLMLDGGLWCWAMVAGGLGVVRALKLRFPQNFLTSFCILAFCVLAHALQANDFTLWIPADGVEPAAQADVPEGLMHESVLYAQPDLLSKALSGVHPGSNGTPELYLLAFGGYGDQDVFLHEVESVERLFSERFGTQDHSVLLVNSPQTLVTRPMATTIALREALDDIGKKMNREEDVLFLFMTSHGAQDHHFALELGPYVFDELTPQVLRKMLDESGIKNRVILVSACYSGGFIHDLKSRNTLVMTASREDRSSHGCQQGADWTFFGKAYFDEALRHTSSFEKAFGEASVIVANREREEEVTPSEPQMSVGSGIRPVLAALEKALRQNGAKRDEAR